MEFWLLVQNSAESNGRCVQERRTADEKYASKQNIAQAKHGGDGVVLNVLEIQIADVFDGNCRYLRLVNLQAKIEDTQVRARASSSRGAPIQRDQSTPLRGPYVIFLILNLCNYMCFFLGGFQALFAIWSISSHVGVQIGLELL